MVQEVGCIVRRERTNPGELRDMLVAPQKWDGEPIDKEE
jgi:hypothetical protein